MSIDVLAPEPIGLTHAPSAEDLHKHPYMSHSSAYTAQELIYNFPSMMAFQQRILEQHRQRPIDALIGDDVSGRVPTLVTRAFMRLAHMGGHIDSMPRTYFMTSGLNRGEQNIQDWEDNSTRYAGQLATMASLRNVLVITEIIGTGNSVSRLKNAFIAHGVDASHAEARTVYLSGPGGSEERRAVGVEKYPPEPVSRRHPHFDGRKASELRSFINNYAEFLYVKIFGTLPPTADRSFEPRYPTELRRPAVLTNARRTAKRSRSFLVRFMTGSLF